MSVDDAAAGVTFVGASARSSRDSKGGGGKKRAGSISMQTTSKGETLEPGSPRSPSLTRGA